MNSLRVIRRKKKVQACRLLRDAHLRYLLRGEQFRYYTMRLEGKRGNR